MQAVTTYRSTASVSLARQCSARVGRVSHAKLSPAAPRRSRSTFVHAEADNAGESITNSGQTKGKDSYEVNAHSTVIPPRVDAERWLNLVWTCFCMPLQFRALCVISGATQSTATQSTNATKLSEFHRLLLMSCCCLQKIEAPVRGEDSADKSYAYGGKSIGDRQSDVDRLLVDQNEPEEKSFLGTEVAFPDALRFKGAAPEVANSR